MKQFLNLFFWISFGISAQTKGVVKDSLTGQPISYVNIWIENENIGTTSEEDGSFSLPVKETKNIIFSALGYEIKTISSSSIATVFLSQKTTALEELVIEKRKAISKVVIGDFSGLKLNSGVTNTGQDNVHVWAKFIKSNETIKKHPFIESIEFVTRSALKNVLLRIRVFNVDKEGNPTGDEVEEDILVPIKKGKKNNIVDLIKYNIKIPEEGIIIGFEYLKLEQNKKEHLYSFEGQKEKVKGYSYEPTVLGFFPGSETLLILNRDGSRRSTTYGNVEIALKIKLSN